MANAALPRMTLRVAAVADATPRIRVFTLVRDDGDLPAFEAGAHIDVLTGVGVSRSYSLAGDPSRADCWQIAVLREQDGRGSVWMHDHVKTGDRLEVAGPRNAFPLDESASEHILLAGGVGITPIRSMAYRLAAIGARFRIIYCTRSAAETAFGDDLLAAYGERVELHHDGGDPSRSYDLAAALRDRPQGAHIYVCGPRGLINGARAATSAWPDTAVHVEVFASAPDPAPARAEPGTDRPFEVELARSGLVLQIPADRSILDVVLEAGIKAPYVCREGWCGNCRSGLLAGCADHRDDVLEDDEKAAQSAIHICISRAMPGERLVIDR